MRLWIILTIVMFFCSSAYSADSVKSIDFTIHQEYVSTRALGMGNAFTAAVDDFSAIFYNPANLAWREDGHLRMFARASASPSSDKLFKEIGDIGKLPEQQQTAAYVDLITRNYGNHFNYRVPTAGFVWARPGWGLAFIPLDASMDIGIHRQIGPMLNVNLYQDSTLALSYASKSKLLGKLTQFSWGTTLKAVHRIHAGQAISAGQLAMGSKVYSTDLANEGLTFDLDIGTSWKPTVPTAGFFKFLKYMQPTFAIVGRNLVDYGFKKNFHLIDPGSGEPPRLVRRFDFGSKWDLPKFWVFDPHFSVDIRDVGHPNWTLKKGSHAGFEFYWKMFNWWKGHWAAGLNQGYWTAGFGARMAFFQLDLATSGEEVGTASAPRENRRFMAELALDF
jgi:hypothetical protein